MLNHLKSKLLLIFCSLLNYTALSQGINHEFTFNNTLNSLDGSSIIKNYKSSSTSHFMQDVLKIGEDPVTVYNINNVTDGLIHTVSNYKDYKDYSFNMIFNMPASSSWNRLHMFYPNSESGIYRVANNFNFYNGVLSFGESLLPKSGFNYTHLAFTRDGKTNTIKIYINGNLRFTTTNSNSIHEVPSTGNFIFFKDNGVEDNVAKVAYLNVANYVQSDNEIKYIYDNYLDNSYNSVNNFYNNLLNDNNINSFITKNENYGYSYDTNYDHSRKSLSIDNKTDLLLNTNKLDNKSYSASFYFKRLDTSNSSFNLMKIENTLNSKSIETLDNYRNIIIRENLAIIGNSTYPIDYDTNEFNLFTITRDKSTKKVSLFINNKLQFIHDDENDELLVSENEKLKFFINEDNNFEIALGFSQINKLVLNESARLEIKNKLDVELINSVFKFDNNLKDSNSNKTLLVKSVDNSHSSNTYSINKFDYCSKSANTYTFSTNTSFEYTLTDNSNHLDFTISYYLNRNTNTNFELANFNGGKIVVNNNIVQLIKNGQIVKILKKLDDTYNFSLITITRNQLNNTISVYQDNDLIGEFVDVNLDFIIPDDNKLILFSNELYQRTSTLSIGHLGIKTESYNALDTEILLNLTCKKTKEDIYNLQVKLANENNDNELIINNKAQNIDRYFLDINGDCGGKRYFYTLLNGESIAYKYGNFIELSDFTINLYYKKNDELTERHRLLKLSNDIEITIENNVLKIGSNEINITKNITQAYNNFHFVKDYNKKTFSIYINGNLVTTINDANHLYSFPNSNYLELFGDANVTVGKIYIYNEVKDKETISEENRAFCVAFKDRIFQFMYNLTDTKNEVTLVPISYTKEHLDNTFEKEVMRQCSTTKTNYYVAYNAGLEFNDGKGSHFYNYTISMYFKLAPGFNQIWYRILDFSNGKSDNGIYRRYNELNFYPYGNLGTNLMAKADTDYVLLTLSRDGASKVITVYMDGVNLFTYKDTQDYYKFPENGNLRFFMDDVVIRNNSYPSYISYIRVSNELLMDHEIINDFNTICNNIACTQKPKKVGTTIPSKFGISTQKEKMNGWPENVNGGNLVLESKEKGFVLPRIKNAKNILTSNNAIPGSILYDEDEKCVKFYDGKVWKCLEQGCVR